ncbi:MAG: hypothetical protein U0T82_00895 [Bacteroidales bacterium]
MKKSILIVSFLLFSFLMPAQGLKMETADLRLGLSEKGQLLEIVDPLTGINYLASGVPAPLLQLKISDSWEEPSKANYGKNPGLLLLYFKTAGITAGVKVEQKRTHLVFELVSLSKGKPVDAVCWGPFPTTISETIGEVIGVVRNGSYAIGLQALNTKTLGGVYSNEEGADFTRGTAAIARPYGSSLQAYSLDRSRSRRVDVWNGQYPEMPVKPIPGETTLGSRIALFACREEQVLERIGTIELAENLPHPMIGDRWVKQSPETGRAYMISDFNEENIDEMLGYVQKAGLMSLYHEGPFLSWGHFKLNEAMFPNGVAGLHACVEKAAALNLRIGVHTLTSFINTNDPYVSPVPDKRLAATGSSVLTRACSASDSLVEVASGTYFSKLEYSTLHAVRIGEEIIRFREVSSEKPYRLIDCQRGAFGTKAVSHAENVEVFMLLDYPYQTLFPDFELQQEIAGNLARFFNETGVSQLDFDGHEGCHATGQGDYAMQAFAEKVFRETHHTLVNGTSRSSHFYWHICHYWNWGEPWYGGFRESQGDYRLDNQPLLERNYMPNMLGWFLLSPNTTVADIDWMMARAAGYKAGFALVASYKSLKKNPHTDELLNLIKRWQDASRSNVFSPEIKAKLKNPANDFHLEKDARGWLLYPFHKQQFEHVRQVLQPGQPVFSEWKFTNQDPDQPLKFLLLAGGTNSTVLDPWIELDGFARINLPGEFKSGYSIACDGSTIALYNEKGSFVRFLGKTGSIPQLRTGNHVIRMDCTYPDDADPSIRLVIRTMGDPTIIPAAGTD